MTLPIQEMIFYLFAASLLAFATTVILSRNPVKALLFLVLCFISSAVLWMLIQSEFLALMLIFVYVGAVMTLFLFVVMMLNLDLSLVREKFVHFLPFSVLVMVLVVGSILWVVGPHRLQMASVLPLHPQGYSNAQVLGELLFTHYLYPLEIAGFILLVAMIAAISLAFHGRKSGVKSQKIRDQHRVQKSDRLKLGGN